MPNKTPHLVAADCNFPGGAIGGVRAPPYVPLGGGQLGVCGCPRLFMHVIPQVGTSNGHPHRMCMMSSVLCVEHIPVVGLLGHRLVRFDFVVKGV